MRQIIFLGILLEVTAAALGTTSKQLIAYSEHVNKKWVFHLGASLNIVVGPIVDAAAYGFAPQIVVAPFACLDVIFNAMVAPYTLHWQEERFTRRHYFGTGLVAVGAALTSVFSGSSNDDVSIYTLEVQLLKQQSIMYLAAELIMIFSVDFALRFDRLGTETRGVCLGLVAGVLMGNVFFLKGVVDVVGSTLTTGDFHVWLRPTPYICIVCTAGGAILGHIFMRRGLGEFKGVFMVTIFEGAHITAACLSGCVVMEEMKHYEWWRVALYWLSLLTLISGVIAINTAAKDSVIDQRHIASSFISISGQSAGQGSFVHNDASRRTSTSRSSSICRSIAETSAPLAEHKSEVQMSAPGEAGRSAIGMVPIEERDP